MKVKDLMIYCTNRSCAECQHTKECSAFINKFKYSPEIQTFSSELFTEKVNILANHGNEEIYEPPKGECNEKI